VKPEHFTVDEFRKVVQSIQAQGLDWAWIDIACINQEDRAEKMDEIGKQASIFKGAESVFVWLCSSSKDVLKEAFDVLWTKSHLLEPTLNKEETWVPEDGFEENLKMVDAAINTIISDPWFTSLWTLQESTLCRKALILSKEGESIPYPESAMHVWLPILVNCFSNVYRDLTKLTTNELGKRTDKLRSARGLGTDRYEQAQKLIDIIDRTGFNHLHSENPNVSYSAAQYRQTKHPLDRIYGIMQVYNIRVGEALRPHDPAPSLELLMDEFAYAINERSPLIGQCFSHLQRPETGKSWRITQFCKVPRVMLMGRQGKSRTARSSIFKGKDGQAKIIGPWTPFKELALAFMEKVDRWSSALSLELDDYLAPGLQLDATPFGPPVRSLESWYQHEKIQRLCETYPGMPLGVIWLGDIFIEHRAVKGLQLPDRRFHGLVVEDVSNGHGKRVLRRLGVLLCTFVEDKDEIEHLPWQKIERVLH
jgi:hypothetical protein